MSIIYEEHKDLIKNVAETNGFETYEIEVQTGSEKGDNYIGELVKITIKNENKKLYVVLKLAPVDAGDQVMSLFGDVFQKEIWIYETLLPEFDRFQRDNSLPYGFEGHAECYAICNTEKKEAIVMEDLSQNGYRLWNRKIPMNHDHISKVVSEYAKFHAVSFAMKKKNPEKFEELKKFILDAEIPTEKEQEMFKVFLDATADKIGKAVKGHVKLEEALKKFMDGADKFILDIYNAEENRMVFIHGDCWCNNILFKYQNPDDVNPFKVCIIDWQLANVRNPVCDLAHFFFTSSGNETYYEYATYLKIYHDSLSRSLRSMSCDPEELYPYSLFEEHWRRYAKTAVFIAPIIFPVLAIDKCQAADLKGNITGQEFVSQLSNAGAQEDAVNQRIRDFMTFMIDSELI